MVVECTRFTPGGYAKWNKSLSESALIISDIHSNLKASHRLLYPPDGVAFYNVLGNFCSLHVSSIFIRARCVFYSRFHGHKLSFFALTVALALFSVIIIAINIVWADVVFHTQLVVLEITFQEIQIWPAKALDAWSAVNIAFAVITAATLAVTYVTGRV